MSMAMVTRPWRLPGSTEVRELHQGRCGRTVLARVDGEGGGLVVVRYVPARLLIHRRRGEAFRADVGRLAGIDVPEVVRLRRYVQAKGLVSAYGRSVGAVGGALVSDAVEGVALSRVLQVHGGLRASAALVVFHRMLRALAAASGRGLVHGDLRPGKVLVGGAAAVTVSGFGLAALTEGAPGVRAPELWRGEGAATAAADVYAAACVFHACLTGDLPFPVVQLFSLMAAHTTAPVPMTGVPGPLRPLLADGLTKDPALRPDAGRLAVAVERVAVRELGPNWDARGIAVLRNLAAPLLDEVPAPASVPPAGAGRVAPSPVRSAPAPRNPSPAPSPVRPQPRPQSLPRDWPQSLFRPQDWPRSLFRSQGLAELFRSQPQDLAQSLFGLQEQLPSWSRPRPSPRSRPAAGLIVPRRRLPWVARLIVRLVVLGVGVAVILYAGSGLFNGDGGIFGRAPAGPSSSSPSNPPSTAHAGACPAERRLSLSPSRGDIHTVITVTGSGVVANGKVEVSFHTDVVGTVPTGSGGCFRLAFAIPDPEHYGNLAGTGFPLCVHVMELGAGGDYQGNGPGEQCFDLTS